MQLMSILVKLERLSGIIYNAGYNKNGTVDVLSAQL